MVISLNAPSKALEKLVEKIIQKSNLKIAVCKIDYPSIAGAYNNGISNSRFQKILLMDSDCTFDPECIKRFDANMGKNLLSKGRVIFQRNSYETSVVARAREFHTSDRISAYSPPLLFKKGIINCIGGYYFHPSLCWLEDSEFDNRVQKASLKISYDPEAQVFHPALTIKRDLNSAFWYGVGKRIGVIHGIHTRPTGILGSIKKYIFDASKTKGVSSGLYLFLWKMTLLSGYYTQTVFKIRRE